MAHERLMHAFSAPASFLACVLLPGLLTAQATADRARLAFSVGVGQTSGGGTLWFVGNQPVIPTDTIAITRQFRRTFAVAFTGTYFPGKHLGLAVEALLLGLGTTDRCQIIATGGGEVSPNLCAMIDGVERSASSVAFTLGGVYRIASDQPIHPYVRVNAGLVMSPQSFIQVFPVYSDDGGSTLHPTLSFGGGAIVVLGRGYQLRLDLRDNWLSVPTVTAPTAVPGPVPHTGSVDKHFLSVLIGLEVVLERKRGKRY
jgi:hypothetical protein